MRPFALNMESINKAGDSNFLQSMFFCFIYTLFAINSCFCPHILHLRSLWGFWGFFPLNLTFNCLIFLMDFFTYYINWKICRQSHLGFKKVLAVRISGMVCLLTIIIIIRKPELDSGKGEHFLGVSYTEKKRQKGKKSLKTEGKVKRFSHGNLISLMKLYQFAFLEVVNNFIHKCLLSTSYMQCCEVLR